MMKKNRIEFKILIATTALISGISFSGCINDNQSSTSSKTTADSGGTASGTGTGSTSASGPSFSITTVTITSPTTTTTTPPATTTPATPPTATIIFNANNLANNLTDVCQPQNSANTSATNGNKACKCHFVWAETNLSSSATITRTVDTAPSQVTNFQVVCPVPTVWTSEITDQTVVKISVIPDTTKGNTSGFKTNIYNLPKTSNTTTTSDFRDAEGREYKNVYHYSCFDKFVKALTITHQLKAPFGASSTNSANPTVPIANGYDLGTTSAASYSAQSYYYDFYVRSNELGSINADNAGFSCPQVLQNGLPSFFPLDSQFAVALLPSTDFKVAVTSATFLAVNATAQPGNVLGYAALPLADGTCPVFPDQSGRLRNTYRLRQFSAIYPLRYNADGDIYDQSQHLNTIYILDRPVNKLTQDPTKPITRMGPKPCPYSFKTAQFGYKCSTDASLSGWNIDGTQINGDPMCPVYPPPPAKYVKTDGTVVIRPYKPFLPHYLENTAYKACAFASSNPQDPEIVLSHDDNVFPAPQGPSDFYCAKYYPPAGAIVASANGDPFDKPPGDCDLGSSAAAIKTDKTFACTRTFDPSGAVLTNPAAGCCQICAGTNCTAQGGGTTAKGRNAAFTPPHDGGNPVQSINQLPRAIPNKAGGGGCFDPSED